MKKLIILFSLLALTSNNIIIGYCDIKGNVKKPGVYKIEKNQTIQDVINAAGGLKNNSYTDNINLSKLVTDEMVIYIHTKKEIDKIKKINNCICTPIYKYKECNNTKSTTTSTTTKTPTTTSLTTTTEIPSTGRTSTTTSLSTTITTKEIITNNQTTTNKTTQITTSQNNSDNKININTCTVEELINLKGLGESKAKNIIEYRENNGLFKTIEDILEVNGIGNKTFENIKDYIEV